MSEKGKIQNIVNEYNTSKGKFEELCDFLNLAKKENDQSVYEETVASLEKLFTSINKMKFEILFSGEVDSNDAYLEIHAGAGGTESQDWAVMLLRMYTRWAERRDYKTSVIGVSYGEEAGIKSVTICIEGRSAFGWLKRESGVHRLVRISPFDSNARRHTSFSSVWIYPVVDEDIEVVINDKDLKIDTYRASGAGGQHVNTTDSAVRITHLPTKIVVQCQNERSQHKNRDTAFKMLRARLFDLELQKKEQENRAIENSKTDIGWGHQIRSYVLHPYKTVKDLRTGLEDHSPESVLNGVIDHFLIESLATAKVKK